MKHAPLYLLCLIAAVALTACQKKDDPVDDDNTPENPQQTIPQQELETDEVDPSVYKYPAEGDFMNPNLIVIPDYDKVTLTAIDTLAHTATLDFAGDVPAFYKGCVIVPMKGGEAYPMFVKKAEVSGSTVRLDWRPAAIGEVFFDTTIGTGTETKAGSDLFSVFESEIGPIGKQGVQGLFQLHVGVQIYSALLVDDLQPYIIRHKGPFFCLISFSDIQWSC